MYRDVLASWLNGEEEQVALDQPLVTVPIVKHEFDLIVNNKQIKQQIKVQFYSVDMIDLEKVRQVLFFFCWQTDDSHYN